MLMMMDKGVGDYADEDDDGDLCYICIQKLT